MICFLHDLFKTIVQVDRNTWQKFFFFNFLSTGAQTRWEFLVRMYYATGAYLSEVKLFLYFICVADGLYIYLVGIPAKCICTRHVLQ